MLKRGLIVVALFVMGVVFLGNTPETEPTPEPVEVTEFNITEGNANAVHGNTADGTGIAIVWGESDGGSLPTATPVEVDNEARSRYQNIPDDILDQLPDDVRDALDAHFGVSGGLLNSQQLDWWCLLTVPAPYIDEEDDDLIRHSQDLDCGGDDLHKIRLRSKLERQSGSIWFSLVDYDSGWLTNTSIENYIDSGCPAGTFNYRGKGYGRAMLTDWSVISFDKTSSTVRFACS